MAKIYVSASNVNLAIKFVTGQGRPKRDLVFVNHPDKLMGVNHATLYRVGSPESLPARIAIENVAKMRFLKIVDIPF